MLTMSRPSRLICSVNLELRLHSLPVIGASQEPETVAAYDNSLKAGNSEATGEH